MNEQTEQSKHEEEEKLTCPECGKGFQDMRGLTSHARHIHDLGKDEIVKFDKENNSGNWKVFGGVGALILAVITLGRIK